MTSHRESDDAAFDTHLDSLASTASLSTKITSWTALQTALDLERSSIVEAERAQLQKHRSKVSEMIENLSTLRQFEEAGGTVNLPGQKIYVDASASATLADGSREKPYPTLSAALDAKCGVSDATSRVFNIAAGTYTLSRTIVKQAAQDVSFEGQGVGSTILQAGATFAGGGTSDCLRLENFRRLKFKGLTVRFAQYGLRLKSCTGSVDIESCRFEMCGSSGITANHDGSLTQAQQLSFWNGSESSNGGALRIDGAAGLVKVRKCEVYRSARGLRVGDCQNGGLILGCFVKETLESGIYLSSSVYTGDSTKGCIGFLVSGNKLVGCGNNSILVVGGKSNSVQGNYCRDGWNAAIQLFHVAEQVVSSNEVHRCNRFSHNGVGTASADSDAQISAGGNTAIHSSTLFQARITDNRITEPGQGKAGSKIGIRVLNNAYASGNKVFVQGNQSEGCDSHFTKDQAGVVLEDMETRVSGGGGSSHTHNAVTFANDGLTVNLTDDHYGSTPLVFDMSQAGIVSNLDTAAKKKNFYLKLTLSDAWYSDSNIRVINLTNMSFDTSSLVLISFMTDELFQDSSNNPIANNAGIVLFSSTNYCDPTSSADDGILQFEAKIWQNLNSTVHLDSGAHVYVRIKIE